ncbi:hypothetical protein CLOM_g16822 [Closterium sp. NIES-68]|nr:hypothetical protein CLOM_g16822 [Closterium sp. NIES-68]GJP75620.1 hypothetical protein CLOP_g6048 [Closterium sp. NIES-67]
MARDQAQARKRSVAAASQSVADVRPDISPEIIIAPPLNKWSKNVRVGIFAALVLAPLIVAFVVLDLDPLERRSITINAVMSVAGFVITTKLIPMAVPYMLRRNMFGYDINKRGSPAGEIKIPETQGLVVAIVYLVVTILFQHFYFTPDSPWLLEYNAALACICFMAFLGFIDDVLDIPWRVKLILPSFAALPLLMAYSGHTTIVIPKPLRPLLTGITGAEVAVWDLGVLYKVYMGMLVVFCSNSINILAGVNGVEAGQTAVIAASVLLFNIWQIGELPGLKLPLQPDMQQAHLFSIYLILPLLACTLGLLIFNWYPSQVFVGDTFTYFAGMTLAVVGILGHFSETLLLLFLPQVINFIYSVPQLFKFVPCPRHRLPKFDPSTHLLTGSNDLNLVNLFLRLFGPCTEEALCIRLLLFQVLSSLLCFTARLFLQGVYK